MSAGEGEREAASELLGSAYFTQTSCDELSTRNQTLALFHFSKHRLLLCIYMCLVQEDSQRRLMERLWVDGLLLVEQSRCTGQEKAHLSGSPSDLSFMFIQSTQ